MGQVVLLGNTWQEVHTPCGCDGGLEGLECTFQKMMKSQRFDNPGEKELIGHLLFIDFKE